VFIIDDEIIDPRTMNIVHALSPEMIHFMDVYDRAPAHLGTKGPAVVIYTRIKTGVASIKQDGIVHVKHPGYYKAREFYSPNHNDETQNTKQPDYRTTLYWNGNITTNEDSNNEVTFFTCDQTGDYDIIVEGITKRGIPVFGKYQMSVE